jgi:hypothetical protein
MRHRLLFVGRSDLNRADGRNGGLTPPEDMRLDFMLTFWLIPAREGAGSPERRNSGKGWLLSSVLAPVPRSVRQIQPPKWNSKV